MESSKEELQKMVLDFKMSELQLLLGFAGQNKNGRKNDLLRRAQNLIHNKLSIPVEMKIRQIYREMVVTESMNKTNVNSYRSYENSNNYLSHNGNTNPNFSNYEYSSFPSSSFLGGDAENGFNDLWPRKNGSYACIGSHGSGNTNNITQTQLNKPETSFYPGKVIPDRQKCENLTFKKLSFFRYKSNVIPITPMIPISRISQTYEFSTPLILDPQQYSSINWSKKAEKDIRYQVQLRICKLSSDIDYTKRSQVVDDLPLQLSVKVNDKNCQLPPAIPSTNKQGMLLKRMNAPINVTPQMHRSRANSLVISWSVECENIYGLAVQLVEKFSSNDLINKLKAKGFREAKRTENYIKNKLDELVDDDISATSLKTSLICPLGKVKMTLPVRATTCNHLQCFDGALYLMMNDVKSTWQCPVCNQSCFYEDLYIDGYFVNALRNEKLTSANEIQINSDGTIESVVSKKRKNTDATRESSNRKKLKDDEDSNIKTEPIRDEVSLPSFGASVSVPELPSFIPLLSSSPSHHVVTTEDESRYCVDSTIASQSTSPAEATTSNKMVVLVDLTESDEEAQKTPNSRQSSTSSPVSSVEEELEMANITIESSDDFSGANNEKKMPPIYNIDEDSDDVP